MIEGQLSVFDVEFIKANEKLKVLELFAGTRSIGKAFESRGHKVVSVEWNKEFKNIQECCDVNTLTAEYLLSKYGYFDVVWCSFDCTTYTIAAISTHRRQGCNTLLPVSEYAVFCDKTNKHVLQLINDLNPKFYFIENPRGGLRKMDFMQQLNRYTVTYCSYGDTRNKPTDIWTNHQNPKFKPLCPSKRKGTINNCQHEKAPRGSRTGTQGLKGSKERSLIPKELCEHIVKICELDVEVHR